jgi:PAS domain S-box-containing protein
MPSVRFRQQWILLTVALLLAGGTIGWNLYAEYKTTDSQERGLLVAQAKVVDKNLEHQLTATNHALDSIRHDLPALMAKNDGMTSVKHRLEVMRGAMPTTRAITIFDAGGTLTARSPDKFTGQNFSHREYFQLARQGQNPARLYVAQPFWAKTNEYVLNVSKVLLNEQGAFAGAILVSLGPEYFDTLLQSVLYAPDMRATLIHGGGKVIFEAPYQKGSAHEQSAAAPDPLFVRHLKSGQATSLSGAIDPFSDTDRLVVLHTIQPAALPMDTPLLVAISRQVPALFSTWRMAVFVQGGLFVVLVLATTLGLFFHQRRQRGNARLLAAQEAKRRQAEASLRQSEENLAITLDSIGDAVIATDSAGRVTRMNPTAERLSGWTLSEARNHNLAEIFRIINAQSRETVPDPVDQVLAKGAVVGLANHTILLARNGQEYQIADSAAPIRNAAGEILGVVLVFSDITEKYRAEEEKQRLESQLRQAQKMEAIGTLAGGIAHDFNNILAIIFGYNELALLEADPEMCRHYLEELNSAAARARDLVQQILAFSRQAEQQWQPLQISLIIKEALKLLRASIPTTIDIRPNIVSSGRVMADPTQVHQIIMNLCTNAYYAMRETGGILAVALTEVSIGPEAYGDAGLVPGDYLKLEVSDTGGGMDAKTREKIFEPYFTTKKTGEGTGLGLAVVHGIVKSHHGHIEVHSELGKGTSFHVYLPLSDQPAIPSAGKNLPTEHKSKGERVLFVDDETQMRRMVETLLSTNGYQVTCFADGKQAWEAFQQNPEHYDLVVTDMTMPVMNGADLAKNILAVRQQTPVILCSGRSDLINGEKAMAMGIFMYLNKPVPSDTLLGAIRAALDEPGS